MTESVILVRHLTSMSQHVSWSRLESSEVTKGMIVPFDPSSFSAIELIRGNFHTLWSFQFFSNCSFE